MDRESAKVAMSPRAVLVTGAPGSGKSTLARELSVALRVPLIARDDVRGGLLFSAGAWGDSLACVPSAGAAVEVFLDSLENLLTHGVTCVVEYVFRAHRSTDLDRIRAVADCVVVKTRCEASIDRFAVRNRGDLLISQQAILDAVGFESVEAHTTDAIGRMLVAEREMLVEFPVPVLDVDTTDGYDPPLPEILDFVTR